jgi:hypothetical protein
LLHESTLLVLPRPYPYPQTPEPVFARLRSPELDSGSAAAIEKHLKVFFGLPRSAMILNQVQDAELAKTGFGMLLKYLWVRIWPREDRRGGFIQQRQAHHGWQAVAGNIDYSGQRVKKMNTAS